MADGETACFFFGIFVPRVQYFNTPISPSLSEFVTHTLKRNLQLRAQSLRVGVHTYMHVLMFVCRCSAKHFPLLQGHRITTHTQI